MALADTTRLAVAAALASTFASACATFVAYGVTGSSAMLSAAVLALVATSSLALLRHGGALTQRTAATSGDDADAARELSFWSYVVAMLLLSLGSGIAIYQGVERLIRPSPIERAEIAYGVLAATIGLLAVAAYLARAALPERKLGGGMLDAVRALGGPARVAVVLQHAAALAGSLTALAGIAAADLLGWIAGDAVAAILVGLILAVVAAVFAIEIKRLLAGAPASAGPGAAPPVPTVATSDPAAEPSVADLPQPVPAPARGSLPAPPHPHGTRKKGKKRRR